MRKMGQDLAVGRYRVGTREKQDERRDDSPVIHRLVRCEQHQIQTLQHVPPLNLPAEEERDSIVESREGLMQHDLVGRRERADNDEGQVGRRSREDDMRG